MFSEITTEGNIHCFVNKIKIELKIHEDQPEVTKTLKEIGRFALAQFEWSEPAWAQEYHDLFGE